MIANAFELPARARSPWQRFYARAHAWRRRWYRTRQVALGRPTISVGNLLWGGGGKTPLVAALADHLRERGERVAILSRGYRRRGRMPLLVSRGDGPLLPPSITGDEPYMLALSLPGVVVVVAADRLAASRIAAELDSTVFVLDDAFSHLRVARDLDILALPAHDPFGGGRLLPSGRLREPLAATARADALVLTGAHGLDLALGPLLASRFAGFGFTGPGFAATLDAEVVRTMPTAPTESAESAGIERGVVLVSGVAHPGAVERTARDLGIAVIEHLVFRDHHDYPERTLERIRAVAQRHSASVLTTAKDWGKLAPRLGLPVAELRIRCRPEAGFWSWLDAALAAINQH